MAVAAPIFGALALSVRKQRTAVLCGATSLVAWLVILQAFQRAPILSATAAFIALGAGILIFKRCQTRSPQRVALMLTGLIIVAVLQLVVFAATPGEDFHCPATMAAVSAAEDKQRSDYSTGALELKCFVLIPSPASGEQLRSGVLCSAATVRGNSSEQPSGRNE